MKSTFLATICSAAMALAAFAQTPSPALSPAPAATAAAAISPSTFPTATPSVTVSAPAPAAASTPQPLATVSNALSGKLQRRLHDKLKQHHITISTADDPDDAEADGDTSRHDHSSGDIPDSVVPIVAIVMMFVFGTPVMIVFVIMYFSMSKTRALHRTVRSMVEKGQEVPAALLNPPPAARQRSDMRRGITLLMIGLGLMIFFGAVNDWNDGVWSLGLIPFLIGAGYLLVWRLEGKKDIVPPLP